MDELGWVVYVGGLTVWCGVDADGRSDGEHGRQPQYRHQQAERESTGVVELAAQWTHAVSVGYVTGAAWVGWHPRWVATCREAAE